MIGSDSTGGTSHGSGNPPVFHFKRFASRLLASGYSVESDELASYLVESVGYQTLTSYLDFFERICLQDHMKSLSAVNDVFDFVCKARILLLKAIGSINDLHELMPEQPESPYLYKNNQKKAQRVRHKK